MKNITKYIICIILVFLVAMGGGYAGYMLAANNNTSQSTQITKTTSAKTNETSISEVAESAAPSVVEIRTETVTQGMFMQEYVSEGAGSGVIISSDGYIVTNNHVISGARKITVTLKDETSYTATLIGTDSTNDIAVLKIDAKDLTAATIGDSSTIVVGETAIAIGNPLGQLGGTVTEGIISATSRQITIDDQEMTLLQTSAAINPGNSGGGLFNINGELIGIVNAKSSGSDVEGLGFAIPINTAISIAEEIMDKGYASGNYTVGISIVEITDSSTAKQYGVDKTGLYIARIVENSDAEKAGLQSGDLIVSINGKEVSDFDTVRSIIKKSKSGDVITFVVERDGKETTIKVNVS